MMQEKMIKDKKIINFETKAITDDYIEDISNKIQAQLMVLCAEKLSFD